MKDFWIIAIMIIAGWLFDAIFKKKAKAGEKQDRLADLKRKSATSKPESGGAARQPVSNKPITLEEIFARAGAKTKPQTTAQTPRRATPQGKPVQRQTSASFPPSAAASSAALALSTQEPVSETPEPESVESHKVVDALQAKSQLTNSIAGVLPVMEKFPPWQQALILHEIFLAPVSQRMRQKKYNMMPYSACRSGKGS